MATLEQLAARVQARAELPAPTVRRALRQAAGVSLAEGGSALGVTGECVRLWELGHRNPRGANLEAYLALLGVFKRTMGGGP